MSDLAQKLTPEQHRTRHERLRDDRRAKRLHKLLSPAATAALVPIVALPAVREQQPLLAQPPKSNRGANSSLPLFRPPATKLDALRVSFPIAPDGCVAGGMPNVDAVRELMSGKLHVQAEDRLKGMWSYEDGCQWNSGDGELLAILVWTSGRGEAAIEIKGKGLTRIEGREQMALMRELDALGGRPRRIDAALDDYMRLASMDEIHAAVAVNNITGFCKYDPRRPTDVRTNERIGDSVLLGSRGNNGSGKYMRIYDKKLEMMSRGIPEDQCEDCIRYELELADEKAEAAWRVLLACDSVDAYAQTLGRLAVSGIEFVKRDGYERYISRAPRLTWWVKLLKYLEGRLALQIEDYRTTLAGAVDAMKHQYGRTLALVRMVAQKMEVNFLNLVDSWCDQLEPKINWKKQADRDMDLPLAQLLAAT